MLSFVVLPHETTYRCYTCDDGTGRVTWTHRQFTSLGACLELSWPLWSAEDCPIDTDADSHTQYTTLCYRLAHYYTQYTRKWQYTDYNIRYPVYVHYLTTTTTNYIHLV